MTWQSPSLPPLLHLLLREAGPSDVTPATGKYHGGGGEGWGWKVPDAILLDSCWLRDRSHHGRHQEEDAVNEGKYNDHVHSQR